MTEFWEEAFNDKQEMWGFEPANAAIRTVAIFSSKGLKNILIPGIGYGRNAQVFIDKGMKVSGIEISHTAIALAEKYYGTAIQIQQGSVTDMPFDQNLYDGIFCHAVIHLLDAHERKKLIADCYHQLEENGEMFFSVITKAAQTYGQGTLIGKDRYKQFGGVNMFFYDKDSIQEEYAAFGLYQVDEMMDNFPFYLIQCRKQ